MDKFTEMETFLRIAEAGSLAAAGRRLGRTPSSVSKLLTGLEERLGARLVTRTTRSLALTDSGTQFLARCQSILAELEEAEVRAAELHRMPGGRLRAVGMNILSQSLLVPLITGFLRANPGITIDLVQAESLPDLTRAGADVGLRIGSLSTKGLVCEPLAVSRRVTCASPAYLVRHGRPARFEDLADHNCLTFGHNAAMNRWQIECEGRVITLQARGDFTANRGELIRQAALAGWGVCHLSDVLVGPDLLSGRLVALFPEQIEQVTNHVCAIYPRRQRVPRKVTAFVEHLRTAFTPVPPWHVDS